MTGRNQNKTPCANSPHERGGVRLCAAFLITILACANLFAQQTAPGHDKDSTQAAEDTSKQVDESEENYRTRMELRDQRYREQPRADMIYSSQVGTEKIDQLPEASREHIKEQLRDMIIASRQWKPGEDVSDYPYEPSSAAQTDTKLRSQEREAWAEQLQKYQQREAAAYSSAEGNNDAQAGGQQSGSESEGAGKGSASGSAGTNAAATSQSQAKSARNAASYEASDHATEEISTAGVSENALSFLQSKGGQAGATMPQAEDAETGATGEPAADDSASASGSPVADAPPGSIARSELALLQGMNAASEDASDNPSTEPSPESPTAEANTQQTLSDKRSDEASAAEDEVETLAGTLTIDELNQLDSAASNDTESAAAELLSGETTTPVAANPDAPGTLDIAELKNLGEGG